MLELSFKIRGISTSAKARRSSGSRREAVGRAKAHLRYIDRPGAVSSRMWYGLEDEAGKIRPVEADRGRARAAMRAAIEDRAGQGGKTGARVAEKIMFSLPNDFDEAAARKALAKVIGGLVGDSEAKAFGVIHRDKPGNLHCHLELIDGRESERAARKRNPDAKRLRRRQHLRFGDLGRPKEVRAFISQQINAVADERGLSGVEHRSFKERGISRLPGQHSGPERIARQQRDQAKKAEERRRAQEKAVRAALDRQGQDRAPEAPRAALRRRKRDLER
jgi:hypothetical protein